MPMNMPGEFHVDRLLTNILIGYRPQGFIADQLFPVVNVNNQTNIFATIDKGNFFRTPNTRRAPGAFAREVSYVVGSQQYVCKNYELATVVPYETLDNADEPHKPMEQSGQLLLDNLMMDYETRVYSAVVGGVGTTTTNAAGTAAAWDDFANSDPIGQCEAMGEAIRKTTGFRPNLCIVGWRAWLKMRRHPDLVRAAYPGAGVGGLVTPEQFGNIVGPGLQGPAGLKVIVAEPIKNTADEGQADSFTDVWSTHVVMAYVADAPGLMRPTFGYTFRWTGANIGGNSPGNFAFFTMRDDRRKVQHLQTGYYQDEKIVAAELGSMIVTGIQ